MRLTGERMLIDEEVGEYMGTFGLESEAKFAESLEALGLDEIDEEIDVGVVVAATGKGLSVDLRDDASLQQDAQEISRLELL